MNNVAKLEGVSAEVLMGAVVDEFLERLQRGERPEVEEYIRQHPQLAAVLRHMLPALQLMHLSAADAAGPIEDAPAAVRPEGPLGDFRIVREIGRGGMGVVYEAVQISLGRRVALKVLPFAAALDAKQLQRFQNEARAAAGLHHEHIVPVHAVGCERGVHYYAMQFIDGQTLGEMIARRAVGVSVPIATGTDATAAYEAAALLPSPGFAGEGLGVRVLDRPHAEPSPPTPLPQSRERGGKPDTAPVAALSTQLSGPRHREYYRTAARLIAEAADALEHAHSLGIVHRDVKPGNLMVDAAGKLWVTDFGLARFGPDAGLTASGDLLGTLRYMAPEQVLARHGLVDHRADVYALGATLYELLTRRSVVDAAERTDILRQIAFEEPTRPRKLDKSIPTELETITMKCLAKNPAERYATAGELADDLRRFQDDQPIRARRAGSVERARRWGRRHPALVAVYGLLVLVLTLASLGGAAAWQWQVAEAARGQAVAALQGEQEAQANEAEAQRQHDKVRALNDELQRTLYAAHMNLAHNAWEAGGIWRMRELLELHLPKPGGSDLRSFEWHYLSRLCHSDLLTLKGAGEVTSVAFSPDGKRLASGTGSTDAATGPGEVRVWDVQTGQELYSLKGHTEAVQSVAFSPDGKRLATASGDWRDYRKPGEVKVWDALTGQVLFTIKGDGYQDGVTFSPDGNRLACGAGDKTVKVWDAHNGRKLHSLEGHTGSVFSVAFSPDGKRLASTGSDGMVKVWDAQTSQELHSLKGRSNWLNCVAFSPDGKRLASAGGEGTVWDVQTGQPLLTLKGGSFFVAFSPDGKRLASASHDDTVKVLDAQTGQEHLILKGHTSHINSVAFGPDGKRLASASYDGTAKVWDAQNDHKPLTLQAAAVSRVNSVAFSPDGKRLVTASSDGRAPRKSGEVKVWDALTGQEIFALKGQTALVMAVAFSPDGKRLASTGSDRTVKVWDALTGQELLTCKGHSGRIRSVTFSPDIPHAARIGVSSKVWKFQVNRESMAAA